MKFFSLDSPFMQALNKVADLMVLNLLTLVCCIPVITVGPSLAALHYTALKMARNEECYIARDFFKSFKANFKQGVLIWLLMLFLLFVLWGDFFIMKYSGLEFGSVIQVLLIVIAFMMAFTSAFIFPVLARFENTIWKTIRNAFMIGTAQLPKTILMMILSVTPAALFLFVPQIIPIVLLFGFSAPAWASAKLYSGFFRKLEEQIIANRPPAEKEEEGEDVRIFKDELDESLRDDPW